MRGTGIIALLIGLGMLAYGWFALGWDGGTDRVIGDWIVIGVGLVLGIGAVALIARRNWGWPVAGLGGLAAAALWLMAPLY
jgi:hypothetical protein